MQKMIAYAISGGFVGFVVLAVMFAATAQGPDRGILFVLAFMGAIPVAATCALFAAFKRS